MKMHFHFSPFLFGLMAVIATVCCADEKAAYITQTYIDTLIQQAYNTLNATEEISRAALSKEDAIYQAKLIVKKLKAIAESDRNKKYILWKTGELESQIYLEEKGILLEKAQKQQKAVNEIIPPFNSELAKPRPDFSRLNRLCEQMRKLDFSKANELQASFDDRRRNITREAVASIEQAIDRGNFDKAREELAYCKINRDFLELSQTVYGVLEAKVQARVSVGSEVAFISSSLEKGNNACKRNLLGEARTWANIVDSRLGGIKGNLYQREWDKLYFGSRRLAKAIERKEDSLTAACLSLLKEHGIGAATEFSDGVLKKYDLPPEKIAKVNYTILEAAISQGKKDTSAISREVVAVVDAPKDTGSVMDDILAAAKQKAKAPPDSTPRLDMARLTFAERIRVRNMRLAQEGKRQREEQLNRENLERANHALVSIYALIDQNKPKEAADQFKEQNKFLKEYLSADAYNKLDSAFAGRR